VFTQPYATQLVLLALEEAVQRGTISDHDVTLDKLEMFLSRAGRRFYRLPGPVASPKIILERKGEVVPLSVKSADGQTEVGLSRGGDKIWSLRWKQ
jgi:dihydroorotase